MADSNSGHQVNIRDAASFSYININNYELWCISKY
jgi:hypothetical protein